MIHPQRLLDWPFEEVVQTYTARDSMLYALGIGLGLLHRLPVAFQAQHRCSGGR